MSASGRELPASRHDLDTYWGRVKQAADISDPRTLFVSSARLANAQAMLAAYRDGRLAGAMTPELWQAKKIVDATLHPAGMLTPGLGTAGTVLWQVANQSLNVAINHANANKSAPLGTGTLVQSYLLAVTASCSVAVGLRAVVPRLRGLTGSTRLVLGRLVPFAAVATAGALNVCLMRGEEMRRGIDVFHPETGACLGRSRRAARLAVGETAVSRVLNATPIMVLPPLLLVRLQRTAWLRARPGLTLPVNLGLIFATSVLALPLALGAFPQRQAVRADSLEREFWGRGGRDGQVEFNRGI
ncbi:Sideroflexin FSF1 [Ophidiomyces ophidiicola]|nr:Sideroflexin FSF1 [Ophidiomyces ophidiicola]